MNSIKELLNRAVTEEDLKELSPESLVILALRQSEEIARLKREPSIDIASIDRVTTLPNQAFLRIFIERALEHHKKGGKGRAAILLLRIDGNPLEEIPEKPAGKNLLRTVATALDRKARSGDILGYWEGKTFLAFLSRLDIDNEGGDAKIAVDTTSRLREAVKQGTRADVGIPGQRSVSVGIALTERFGYDLDVLVAYAVKALACAQSQGEDRVEFATL